MKTLVDSHVTKIQTLETTVNAQVIFSAVRKAPSGQRNDAKAGEVITFSDTVANIGQGMDTESGTFTVPISGLYSFSFSALASLHHKASVIYVYRNEERQFTIVDEDKDEESKNYDVISYNWMMSLVQNDKIHLKLPTRNMLYVNDKHFVWFNGQLLKGQ